MASELDYDKLVKDLKANDELTQKAAAEKQGLTVGQVSMLAFCQAKVDAGIYDQAPATSKSVKNLRDNEENRWELISARTGVSVAQVKALYEEAGGDVKGYVGRGRNFNGAETPKKATTGRGAKAKAEPTTTARGRRGGKTTGVQVEAPAKTGARAGRGRQASAKAAGKTGQVVRNRRGRRSTAGNPS